MKVLTLGAAALFAAGASAADFDIFKCTTQDGAVTYQPLPCPRSSEQKRIEVLPFSAGFDPSDSGRVFKREAELDKRRVEVAKEEQAARAGGIPEESMTIGKARYPAQPTETSNESSRQSFVSNAAARRH